MADKSAKAKSALGRRLSWMPIGIGLTFVLVIVISLPTVLLVFFGMLPTLVAAIIDRTRQRYATFCVGGMNFCGVFPYLLDLWAGPGDIAAATEIFTNVFALMLMYTAAGVGWVLFLAIPPAVVSFLQVMAQRRAAQCRVEQRRLVEEWGEDITHPPSELDGGRPHRQQAPTVV